MVERASCGEAAQRDGEHAAGHADAQKEEQEGRGGRRGCMRGGPYKMVVNKHEPVDPYYSNKK
jgi:hypothetical protein